MNNIEIKENYAEIIIDSPKYGTFRVSIDKEDVPKVQAKKWCVVRCGKSFYVKHSSRKEKCIPLHRYVLNYDGELQIDHIDRNPLNNTKDNLRIVDSSTNLKNRGGYGSCSYKYMRIIKPGKEHKQYRYDVHFPNQQRKVFKNMNEAKAYYIECLLDTKGGE